MGLLVFIKICITSKAHILPFKGREKKITSPPSQSRVGICPVVQMVSPSLLLTSELFKDSSSGH